MPTFTHDMHTCFPSGAEEAFGHLRGAPARFLEIGTFEGQSACWMLENILTHPDAYYIGIECHADRYQKTMDNLLQYPDTKRAVFCGMSDTVLQQLERSLTRFNAIYVDGDHREEAAYVDSVGAWKLLAPGGVILFDDFTLKESSIDSSQKFNVEKAVNRVLDRLDPRHYSGKLAKNGYQYIVRKLP